MNTRNAISLLISFFLIIVFTFFMCSRKQSDEQVSKKEATKAAGPVIKARITSVTGIADILRRGRS